MKILLESGKLVDCQKTVDVVNKIQKKIKVIRFYTGITLM